MSQQNFTYQSDIKHNDVVAIYQKYSNRQVSQDKWEAQIPLKIKLFSLFPVPCSLLYQQILLPQTVLAEVAYLVVRSAGISTVVAFLKGLSASRFNLISLSQTDVIRVSEILEEYKDICLTYLPSISPDSCSCKVYSSIA